MKKYITIGIIVVLAIVLFVSGRSTYNSMVTLDQDVEEAWGKVQYNTSAVWILSPIWSRP